MTDHVTDTNVGKMTPQEASEILETDISNIGIMRDGYTKGVSHDTYNEAVGIAREALQFQQSVVRCGECKHKVDREFNRVVCMRHTIETHKDGFCHNGKRRDEE